MFKIISTCDVPHYLQSVCLTGEREAAATVNQNDEDRHEIHLFRVRSGNLLKTRTISLQHDCRGVAYHSDKLYITTWTDLHVYDITNGQSRQLHSDHTGMHTVHKCAVSTDGSLVFITNSTHNQLITLNKDGTKLSTLTHPELQNPVSLHVTPLGQMFVSCCGLDTVVQVVRMKDGKQTVKPMAGKRESLNKPIAVYFNNSHNTLVVGMGENDNIVEVQLKP